MGSDEGYGDMGRGGWALVVRLAGGEQCYVGRMRSPWSGTYSSYRSEAYSLSVGMWVAWPSQIEGDITLTLDNQSAAKVLQNCEHTGLRLVSSQDCWDEILWLHKTPKTAHCQLATIVRLRAWAFPTSASRVTYALLRLRRSIICWFSARGGV